MSHLIKWDVEPRLIDRLGAGWKTMSSSFGDGPPYRLMILRKSKIAHPILIMLFKLIGWKQWKEVAHIPDIYHGQKNHYVILTENRGVFKVLDDKIVDHFEIVWDGDPFNAPGVGEDM